MSAKKTAPLISFFNPLICVTICFYNQKQVEIVIQPGVDVIQSNIFKIDTVPSYGRIQEIEAFARIN